MSFERSRAHSGVSLTPSAGASPADRINPAAFSVPAPGTWGNAGRNILRGPNTRVFDFSLQRDFPIRENMGLEFRWEVFNLFNTTQFALPARDFSSSAAGTITTLASDPRVMQFALRFKF